MRQSLLYLSIAVCGIFSLAATFREQAENERQNPKQEKTATLPTNSAMLSLEDPRGEIITRSWKYSFNFLAQQFNPRGVVRNDIGTSFNLNNNNSVIMPTAGFGFSRSVFENLNMKLKGGAQALVGYTNQASSVNFSSGIVERDVRLSSILARVKPVLNFSLVRWPWASVLVGGEWGFVNYTQSSSNDLANFSKQSMYSGWSTGIAWNATQKFSVIAQYTNRSIQDRVLDIQRDNFEIGTTFLW